jgi:Peptidase M50B-like
VIAATVLVAAALVIAPRAWSVTRHVATIAHEAGHAVLALLTGRRLAGIRLHSDSSGVTISVGRAQGAGMALMLAAGYPGPALLGLGSAGLLHSGRAAALLWLLVALLAAMLVQVRNWFGLWSVLASAVVVFGVTWWLPGRVQVGFAYVVTWFLLLSAPREVVGLVRARRSGARGSDADQLARITPLPPGLWVTVFFLLTSLAAVAGTLLIR